MFRYLNTGIGINILIDGRARHVKSGEVIESKTQIINSQFKPINDLQVEDKQVTADDLEKKPVKKGRKK